MELKKTTQADVHKDTSLFFLIGLNIALLGSLLIIEFSRESSILKPLLEEAHSVPENLETPYIVEVVEPQTTSVDVPVDIPDVLTDVDVTDDDTVINDPIVPDDPRPSTPQFSTTLRDLPSLDTPGLQNSTPIDENTNNNIYNRLNITEAPIYPGCEKKGKKQSKEELLQCFSQKFNSALERWIQDVQVENKVTFHATLLIDKKGYVHIKNHAVRGAQDPSLEKELLKAYQRVSEYLIQQANKKKGVEPAKNKDGEDVNMELLHSTSIIPQK